MAVVGTRADLYPLGPVLREVVRRRDLELEVVTTLGFGADGWRRALADLGLSEGSFAHRHLETGDGGGAVDPGAAGPRIADGIAHAVAERRPDVVLVLGDRWELLFAVPSLVVAGVPIVHLHGGEVTEGAVDERYRHAVTKLADVHCVATADAAARVRQLGEEDWRIRVTGAPGLDALTAVRPYSESEFAAEFGQPLRRPLVVATLHPETAPGHDRPDARAFFDAVVDAAGLVIVTHPGRDEGREEILAEIERVSGPRVIVRDTLGARYPRVMATADAMAGNSSSGIIEAASFGLPVVNVGTRQRGRLRGGNVIDAGWSSAAIAAALRQALEDRRAPGGAPSANPYGDGHAAPRIVDALSDAAGRVLPKSFVDHRREDDHGQD